MAFAEMDNAVRHEEAIVRFDKALEIDPRVTLIENFASNAAVQKLVDVKPDRTCPEIL